MTNLSLIEIKDFSLETSIGTYGPADTVPERHLLDLSLSISSDLVLIDQDAMDCVFDYDPLIVEIETLAAERHYETQERLITRIVQVCATYPQIQQLEIALSKTPIRRGSGSLGIRIVVGKLELQKLRTL
jgi:FolB domain-containing protein